MFQILSNNEIRFRKQSFYPTVFSIIMIDSTMLYFVMVCFKFQLAREKEMIVD